jgi:hypothetical protein
LSLSKYPRLFRLIFCLALVQVVAPSMVAIAEAWRMDKREAYAHIESETGSGCVVVHHDDCALCAVLSTCGAPAQQRDPWPATRRAVVAVGDRFDARTAPLARSARQRAPPVT